MEIIVEPGCSGLDQAMKEGGKISEKGFNKVVAGKTHFVYSVCKVGFTENGLRGVGGMHKRRKEK